MQQNTWREAILASHKTAKNTVDGGYGALALERKVRKTYYSMPTVFEVKHSNTFRKIPNSCQYQICIKVRTFTNIKKSHGADAQGNRD